MKKRPRQSALLTAEEFAAWYWLKEELVAFSFGYGLDDSAEFEAGMTV